MELVDRFGGFLLGARDSNTLDRWCGEHIGVSAATPTYDDPDWKQGEGPSVWGTDAAGSVHGTPIEWPWTVIFWPRDLEVAVVTMEPAGFSVDVELQSYPEGPVATTTEPQGERDPALGVERRRHGSAEGRLMTGYWPNQTGCTRVGQGRTP